MDYRLLELINRWEDLSPWQRFRINWIVRKARVLRWLRARGLA